MLSVGMTTLGRGVRVIVIEGTDQELNEKARTDRYGLDDYLSKDKEKREGWVGDGGSTLPRVLRCVCSLHT